MTDPGSPRLVALRELAADAELERGDFLYEATEQLRRFLDANRERLREIGPIKLVDDEQDYLPYHPVDETWTTRLTYQDPADNEWYDQEQLVDSIGELVELYNPADIFAWLIEAARDAPGHLVPADELAHEEELADTQRREPEDGREVERVEETARQHPRAEDEVVGRGDHEAPAAEDTDVDDRGLAT